MQCINHGHAHQWSSANLQVINNFQSIIYICMHAMHAVRALTSWLLRIKDIINQATYTRSAMCPKDYTYF